MRQKTNPLILIYGNSLFLHAVERRLRGFSDLRIIHIDPTHPTAPIQITGLQRGVLIYDQANCDPADLHALWDASPDILTVGVTASDTGALTLRERSYSQITMAGLGKALRALLPDEPTA